MKILYAVSSCSDRTYRELFAQTKHKPAFQAQKYHRLFATGLAAWVPVTVLAAPPVNRQVLTAKKLSLKPETEDGVAYQYVTVYRNPIKKLLSVAFGMFFGTLRQAGKDTVVVVDCLNHTGALASLAAARLRGRRCVGILTDLPEMLGETGLTRKTADFVIRHCTDYVFLTQAMNDRINIHGKPYVILEGHADAAMKHAVPDLTQKANPRVVLYAGGIGKRYGLENLVQGFLQADIPDTRLEIYGSGDYVPELETIAREHENIDYGGMLLSGDVVPKEMEATLLVNPRPTHEEFVKYSFPSKTMEYMASGTPVLTTNLPGMPEAYRPYVFLIDQESPEGIAHALRKVLSYSNEELFTMGQRARAFVLEERNNIRQAKKLLDMLQGEKQ